MSTEAKQAVHDFWERASCGEEAYAHGGSSRERLEAQARTRYELEPYIRQFARFESGRGLDVLEVGVGMGADHLEWARHMPRSLSCTTPQILRGSCAKCFACSGRAAWPA